MKNVLLGIGASLSIVALFMPCLICCDHHKSYIDVEKVIDSVANESLSDSIHIEMGDSILHVDSIVKWSTTNNFMKHIEKSGSVIDLDFISLI